eukprot:9484864-Pyramimonas_sp.AAC.1
MHCVVKTVPKWSRRVDFRSAVAQGTGTHVEGLRDNGSSTARVLAVLRSYVHSSAQTHSPLMFHQVGSPPDTAVDGEEQELELTTIGQPRCQM